MSLEHLGETTKNPNATQLSNTLNQAIERLLAHNRSPSRKVNEIDNRAVTLYWVKALRQVKVGSCGFEYN